MSDCCSGWTWRGKAEPAVLTDPPQLMDMGRHDMHVAIAAIALCVVFFAALLRGPCEQRIKLPSDPFFGFTNSPGSCVSPPERFLAVVLSAAHAAAASGFV